MKRFILVGLLLLAFALAVAPATSAYGTTDRGIVRFVGGTFDMSSALIIANGSEEGTSWSAEGYLPAALSEFVDASSGFAIEADGGDINYTLVINGETIVADEVLTDGNDNFYNITALVAAGVSSSATTYDIELTVDVDTWICALGAVADDAEINPDFFNNYMTFAQEDLTTPKVHHHWMVNDTITNNLEIDFTDTNFTISYPRECVADAPDVNIWIGEDFREGDSLFVSYQKYGPAADEKNIDVTSSYGTATVILESNDKLEDALWTIRTTDDIWDGAFNGLNFNTLSIKINNKNFNDFSQGSIEMEDVNLKKGTNEVIFTWIPTTTTPVTPSTADEPTDDVITLDTDVGGVPLWAVLAIAAVIIIAAIAIVKIEKK